MIVKMTTTSFRLALPLLFSHSLMAMANDDAKLAENVEALLPPHVGTCVLAIDHGQVVFEQSFGLADVVAKTPCTPETNFRLASVSKQFTATAVLLLVDCGKISLDDKLSKFFPGFPAYGSKISVKHLLTHTSGLPAYEDLIPNGTTLQVDDLDVLQLLMDTKKPRFAPGAKFEYSNSGYTLLGLIVEVAAQKPFHDFMASDVFRPLGMNYSVLYQRGLNEIPHRAYGHERKDGKWVLADQSLSSAVRGDGGVYSSLRDYRKWLRGIDERKLLSAASYDAMFSPHAEVGGKKAHYGYGWFLDEYRGEPRTYHTGDTRGFCMCVERFPKRNAAVFIQLNSELVGDSSQIVKASERVADVLIFDRN